MPRWFMISCCNTTPVFLLCLSLWIYCLFSIYLNDIDSVTDGAKGALTGITGFTVKHLLFADDLSLPSNEHTDLQTMLNKPKI